MVLHEAKVIARPQKDSQYVFYKDTTNQEILLLNQVSNIYVLNYHSSQRYFINHHNLIQYLMHKLLEQDNVHIITTENI